MVTKKYKDELTDFVKQAADTPGAMIEVQGYASKVGSPRLGTRGLAANGPTMFLPLFSRRAFL